MTVTPADFAGTSLRFFWVAWLDVTGDPVRVTTLPRGHTFASTRDANLDGISFDYLPSELLSIGPVTHGKGGSDTVTAALCGVPGPNDELLAALADRANWQGRLCRLWFGTADASWQPLKIKPYYTGYMQRCPLTGDPDAGQDFSMQIENYLSGLTNARGRTYQDQGEFDAADVSPARMRAAANGTSGAAIVGGGGNSGGSRPDIVRAHAV